MKTVIVMLATVILLSACRRDADVASYNLSYAADNFELDRRVIFYNGITDTYMLTIRGKCAIDHQLNQLEVTCLVGDGMYKKHFLGLSDNVTYFAEQMSGTNVSRYHYEVAFKPQSILPDIDFRGDASAFGEALTPDAND